MNLSKWIFQSTPPARGATRRFRYYLDALSFQSTPPARGATFGGALMVSVYLFQSTPPARGATLYRNNIFTKQLYFNPRPPRGGRLTSLAMERRDCKAISIHAPREGGDSITKHPIYLI